LFAAIIVCDFLSHKAITIPQLKKNRPKAASICIYLYIIEHVFECMANSYTFWQRYKRIKVVILTDR